MFSYIFKERRCKKTMPIKDNRVNIIIKNNKFAYIYFFDGIAAYRIIDPLTIFLKEEIASKKIENAVIQNNNINIINIISCLFETLTPEDPFILNNRINEVVINPK
ncbi:hypothetical protein EMIT079MI2_60101 [Bacillus sp. IT-79MI2]